MRKTVWWGALVALAVTAGCKKNCYQVDGQTYCGESSSPEAIVAPE